MEQDQDLVQLETGIFKLEVAAPTLPCKESSSKKKHINVFLIAVGRLDCKPNSVAFTPGKPGNKSKKEQ